MTSHESTLATALTLTQQREQYDASCKRLLSEKTILAWIMKYTMQEYSEFTTDEIATNFIEGNIEVDAVYVHQDTTSSPSQDTSRIQGSSQEDTSITEGTVTFDIKFLAIAPRSKHYINLIINIEAQSDFFPGYPLVTRGIYYCSRLISSQQGVTFSNSHYEDIQKVYSIWICTNPPNNRRNSINSYAITEDNVLGTHQESKIHYDLLNATMLCLGDEQLAEPASLLKLLDILFSKKLSPFEKKELLEHEFDIPLTQITVKEIRSMGSLGQALIDEGFHDGFNDGFNDGLLKSTKNLIANSTYSAAEAMEVLAIPTEDRAHYLSLLEKEI